LGAVLLLHKYPLGIISSVFPSNSNPGESLGSGLPLGDWQSTKLGTHGVYRNICPVLEPKLDISHLIQRLSLILKSIIGCLDPEIDGVCNELLLSAKIRAVVSAWKGCNGLFDIEIFEKEGCHLLRLAVEKQFHKTVRVILPLYEDLLWRDDFLAERTYIIEAAWQADLEMRKILSAILDPVSQ
jgi:hypothetical protein